MAGQSPKNLTNELAKERNRAAAERTLMAWIRTSLSLISFGFGIDRITEALERNHPEIYNPWRISRVVGLAFIALGTGAMIAAIIEHKEVLRAIRRDDYLYSNRRSIGLAVATMLVLIGLSTFTAIILLTPR
jgi:putative membrane protein